MISPVGLCPKLQDGTLLRLTRKIDYALTLKIDEEKKIQLGNAFYKLSPEDRSVTQCLDLPFQPLIVNLEIKKSNQSRDALVQLAIWIAAGFNKNIQGGYDLTMPVPAIVVEGDFWNLYVAYWHNGRILFLGPTWMGNTLDDMGVFQIMSTLIVIGDWGLKEYRQWFEKTVMKRHS